MACWSERNNLVLNWVTYGCEKFQYTQAYEESVSVASKPKLITTGWWISANDLFFCPTWADTTCETDSVSINSVVGKFCKRMNAIGSGSIEVQKSIVLCQFAVETQDTWHQATYWLFRIKLINYIAGSTWMHVQYHVTIATGSCSAKFIKYTLVLIKLLYSAAVKCA